MLLELKVVEPLIILLPLMFRTACPISVIQHFAMMFCKTNLHQSRLLQVRWVFNYLTSSDVKETSTSIKVNIEVSSVGCICSWTPEGMNNFSFYGDWSVAANPNTCKFHTFEYRWQQHIRATFDAIMKPKQFRNRLWIQHNVSTYMWSHARRVLGHMSRQHPKSRCCVKTAYSSNMMFNLHNLELHMDHMCSVMQVQRYTMERMIRQPTWSIRILCPVSAEPLR